MFVEKSPVKLMFFWDYLTSFRYQLNYTLSNLLYYLRSRVLSNCLAFLSFFGCQKTRTNSRTYQSAHRVLSILQCKIMRRIYPIHITDSWKERKGTSVVKFQVGDTRVAFPRSLRIQNVFSVSLSLFRTNDLNLQVIANANKSEFLINTKATQNYFLGWYGMYIV